MRISAKVDYAIRAMAEIGSRDGPVKTEAIATAQGMPTSYLIGILGDLRRARLLQSQRGPDGGFELERPATEISLADICRAIDGPLAEVHDLRLSSFEYEGPATELRQVWVAVRASLRRVLDGTSLQDLVDGELPEAVQELAREYEANPASTRP